MTSSAHFFGQRIKAYIGHIYNPIGKTPGQQEPRKNLACPGVYPGEGRARCSVDSPDPGLMTTRSLAGPEFRQAPSDAGSATVMSEVVRA